jgi:predicted enzyme related to lactoylglutathione lyase
MEGHAMSDRDEYPAGVPCWVENLTDDVDRTRGFYGELFGWEWSEPGPMAGDPAQPYYVARRRGRDVAGVAPSPAGVAATWMTHVRVQSAAGAARAAERAGGVVVAGPLDVAPAGRLAVLADPAGAALCAFEPGLRRGAQAVNEPGAWAMSLLSTPDPDRAAHFYAELFGWRTEPFGEATLFRLPGYVGGEPEQPVARDVVAALVADEAGPARWDVDFWTRNAQEATAVAERRGGRVLAPIHEAPPFRRAVIADPAGAVLTVSQLVAGPA